ncbi:trichohyalin [Monodelphis domestica]|uniref:trichohyalin n=1 Tax=Monodelphis domestica TaxID=13616 RepID=UPI0024E2435A|nr:trichohyalin [Monodelphis domestica]
MTEPQETWDRVLPLIGYVTMTHCPVAPSAKAQVRLSDAVGLLCPTLRTSSGLNPRTLGLQGWSRSEQDLWSSVLESGQQRVELGSPLRAARGVLKEPPQEIQRREKALELNQMKWELLDLRQEQVESSLIRLEWERRELEMSRRQEQWQDRELHSKILRLQTEVQKVKLCLDRMSQQSSFLEDPQEKSEMNDPGKERSSDANETLEGEEVPLEGPTASIPQESQEMILLQEQLVTIKEMNKDLSLELAQSHQRLRIYLDQLDQLQTEKKISHSQIQVLETERDQLVGENLVLLSVLQGLTPAPWQNGEASRDPHFLELATSQQEPEEEALCSRTHQEVVQYWKARWHQVANELKSKEEELEMIQRQRRSWSCQIPWIQELLVGEEEDLNKLKDAVGRAKEETNKLEDIQLVKLYQHLSSGEDSGSLTGKVECQRDLPRNRLEILEQENAQMALVIQRWKLEKGPTLQIELDACKQELELERNLCLALQHQLRELQGGGAQQRAEPPQAVPGPGPCPPGTSKRMEVEPQRDTRQSRAEPPRPLQELLGSSSGSPQVPKLPGPFQRDSQGGQGAGAPGPLSEAEILRQQLQTERALGQEREQYLQSLTSELQELKLRKSEETKASLLTTQDCGQQQPETAEYQLMACRSENLRLERLVSSLQQKLEETERALKEPQTPRASEQGELEMTPSSLLKKLSLNSRLGSSQLAPEDLKRGPRTGWEGVPQGHCPHCNAFLEQLGAMLQAFGPGVPPGWAASSRPAEEKAKAVGPLQKAVEGPTKHGPRGGRAPRSDLKDIDRVKEQHRLVTAQLQDLFGERRERPGRAGQPPREWPEGSSGDQGAKKPQVEQLN